MVGIDAILVVADAILVDAPSRRSPICTNMVLVNGAKNKKGHPLPDAPICIAAVKMLPNPSSVSRCYIERIGRLYVESLIECIDVEHGAVYAGNGRRVNVLL